MGDIADYLHHADDNVDYIGQDNMWCEERFNIKWDMIEKWYDNEHC